MRTHTTLRRCGPLAVVLTLSASAVLAEQPPRPPQPPPGTVTLSLAEYDRLVDRAERPARRADPPPIPAVVARSDGQVRVVGDRARGTFTLEGEVFASGVTMVPLTTGATIIDARLGTTSLALTREGEMNAALVEGPRAFSITVEWGAPVQHTPGRASLAIPAPMTGAVNAVFELPGTASDVQISPGAVTRTTAGPGGTRVEATLVAATPSRLSWATTRVEATTAREARKVAGVKSVISLRDAEVRVTSLVEVSVLAGQPDRFEITVPGGFVFEGAAGGAVEPAADRPDVVVVRIERPLQRRHQVLVSFERQASATGRLEIALPTVSGAERESGEVAVEASGTVELTLTESDVLRRMDVREASRALGSLAGQTVLAAMRYSRRGSTPATLSLDLTRFPDAPLITAVADRAVATTLLTVDGRTLTEVVLTLRNRAQPFLRVELPAGASMISAEVAGETAKIAQGADGVRVPLLRPGFRPTGPYAVSFVYVHSGQPFAKKGRAGLALPKMDVPIGLVEWEMFVPDRYRVHRFDGEALLQPPPPPLAAAALGSVSSAKAGAIATLRSGIGAGMGGGAGGGEYRPAPGQLVGVVTDESGAVLPGTTITVIAAGKAVSQTTANESGWFLLPATDRGRVTVVADLAGFRRVERRISFDPARPRRLDFRLAVGELGETLTVASDNEGGRDESAQAAPSQNVFNLQQRVAGVLPVRIDVPRAGAAYRFVRPLVLDETTSVSFDYRTR